MQVFFFYHKGMKILLILILMSSLSFAAEKTPDKTVDKAPDKNLSIKRGQVKKLPSGESILISKVVGTAADQVVTSREVQIVNLLEKGLISDKNLNLVVPEDTKFNVEVGQVLLEIVVQTESNLFEFEQINDQDFKTSVETINKNLGQSKEWKNLQVSSPELERFLKRKLIAKRFIKVKSDSMKGFITDSEAKDYFDKNRLKFGQVPFVQFKENIKTFLTQQQLEERLKAWFEITKKKYKVKNYTNES
jgi:glutaredoxin-related protein